MSIGPFFRRRGGETGDHLLVLIDLTTRQATLDLGDETLFEEYQGTDESEDTLAQ
jgi:hypothetical protein